MILQGAANAKYPLEELNKSTIRIKSASVELLWNFLGTLTKESHTVSVKELIILGPLILNVFDK